MDAEIFRRAFHLNSLKRFGRFVDSGLTEAQMDICISLIEKKLVNPEALAEVVMQLSNQCSK